ncbi:MAG: hypothetical protein NTW08_10395 [Gammaproteobacteria bacterium]|nr:hypothetical protein [Gammaproteobacteria bacterium]
MKITVFQALTLLAQAYRLDKEHNETYTKIKSIYLSGICFVEDRQTLDELLRDEKLSPYTISLDREDINEDPVRRYFESHLCHDTLATSLDALDEPLLDQYHESLFCRLYENQKSTLLSTIFSGTEQGGRLLAGTYKEYAETIRLLSRPDSFQSLKPKQAVNEKSPDVVLKERKAKMKQLSKCAAIAQWVIANDAFHSMPLDLYELKNYVFDPIHRGRVPRHDPSIRQAQDVRSQAQGIMRPTMPLPRNDALLAEQPSQFTRPADLNTYVKEKSYLPDVIFGTLVTPFVCSISGTMLMQLSCLAQLLRERQLVYTPLKRTDTHTLLQLKLFIKCFIANLVHHSGGHSLLEFFCVFLLPETQKEFKSLIGFHELTLETLFKNDNEDAFEQAVEKTIAYNAAILQKKQLHAALLTQEPKLKRAIVALRLSEEELRQYLYGPGETLGKRLDQAWDLYNDEFRTTEDRLIAQEFLIYALNIAPQLENVSFNRNDSLPTPSRAVNTPSRVVSTSSRVVSTSSRAQRGISNQMAPCQTQEIPRCARDDVIIARNDVLTPQGDERSVTLNQTLSLLMLDRFFMQDDNPDYIPGRSPSDDLNKSRRSPLASPTQPDRFRALIYHGKFMKKGQILDTSDQSALGKRGFAPFTLNANGDLCIFPNEFDAKTSTDTSVVYTGEVCIKNGMLIAITDENQSEPQSAYHLYKTLNYFKSQGIEISETQVMMRVDPALSLNIKTSRSLEFPHFFVCLAEDFCNPYHAYLKSIINDIQTELKKYQTLTFATAVYQVKDFITRSKLTDHRNGVAKDMVIALSALANKINGAKSVQQINALTLELKTIFDKALETNATLSLTYKKSNPEKERLRTKLSFFKSRLTHLEQQVQNMLQKKSESLEDLSDESLLAKHDVLKTLR